jgi:L-threonate 2-dehydrogenase
MSPAVGIVGVGNMGGAMAARLLEQGWTVRVHDIDRRKVDALAAAGAKACADAAETAQGSSALIVCVVDAGQVEQVLFGQSGALGGLKPGQAVLLCPTISPGEVENFAGRLEAAGVAVIDAPMSGGPARARDGSMSLMVACANEVYEAHRALIETLSSRVFRIGERTGDGARTKLVNNLLAAINLVGAAEAMALAGRLGLDLSRTLDVIEQSSGQSWIGVDRMRRAIAGDWEPRAHVTLLQKDAGLALREAASVGFDGPLGAAAREVFDRTARAGWAALDDAAVFRLLDNES